MQKNRSINKHYDLFTLCMQRNEKSTQNEPESTKKTSLQPSVDPAQNQLKKHKLTRNQGT